MTCEDLCSQRLPGRRLMFGFAELNSVRGDARFCFAASVEVIQKCDLLKWKQACIYNIHSSADKAVVKCSLLVQRVKMIIQSPGNRARSSALEKINEIFCKHESRQVWHDRSGVQLHTVMHMSWLAPSVRPAEPDRFQQSCSLTKEMPRAALFQAFPLR